MIEKYNTSRVQSRILDAHSDLSWIKDKVEEFVNDPTAEAAQELESVLAKFATTSEALKNSITTMAKEIAGIDVDEEGLKEIDVIPEENGLRLS
jgi:hypothetical protein